jgi:LPXTG-site transpeptidase (sortase) family protein
MAKPKRARTLRALQRALIGIAAARADLVRLRGDRHEVRYAREDQRLEDLMFASTSDPPRQRARAEMRRQRPRRPAGGAPARAARHRAREGVDDDTLRFARGTCRARRFPGEPGNVVIAAHRDTLVPSRSRASGRGTPCGLLTPDGVFEYAVTQVEVVEPTRPRVLEPRSPREATLVTCYPFSYVGKAPLRFVVRRSAARAMSSEHWTGVAPRALRPSLPCGSSRCSRAGCATSPVRLQLWNGEVLTPHPGPVHATIVVRNARTLVPDPARPGLPPRRGLQDAGDPGAGRPRGRRSRGSSAGRRRRCRLPVPFRQAAVARAEADASRHYDLGNDFFRLWLDDEMVYTCAYFWSRALTLEQAQLAKFELVCRKLRLTPGQTGARGGLRLGRARALHGGALRRLGHGLQRLARADPLRAPPRP